MLLGFVLGFIWMFIITVQTRLIACFDHNLAILAPWTFFTSVVYCLIVKKISLEDAITLPYALGTTLGLVAALKLCARIEKLPHAGLGLNSPHRARAAEKNHARRELRGVY
jgi:hypothetical protein